MDFLLLVQNTKNMVSWKLSCNLDGTLLDNYLSTLPKTVIKSMTKDNKGVLSSFPLSKPKEKWVQN